MTQSHVVMDIIDTDDVDAFSFLGRIDGEIFDIAFNRRAYRCISYLLSQYDKKGKEQKEAQYAPIAANSADGQMVLTLTNNDFKAAAWYIFNAFLTQPREERILYFLTLLRFMPFETVDKLIETSSKLNLFFLEEEIEMIYDVYSEAKRQYHEIGSYFSQYSKARDLDNLYMMYRYEICLMSDKKEEKIEPGKLYVRKKKDSVQCNIMTIKGNIIEKTIRLEDLPEVGVAGNEGLIKRLKLFLRIILNDMERDHTLEVSDQCDFLGLKKILKRDMDYGKKRQQLVKNLCETLNHFSREKLNFFPKENRFLQLRPSSKGTRQAAALLEKISAESFLDQKQEDFQKIRGQGYTTSIYGYYESALPLIKAILCFSPQSSDFAIYRKYNKQGNNPVLGTSTSRYSPFCNYHLCYKYEGILVNRIQFSSSASEEGRYWEHGRAPIAATWGKIEDLFEEALAMDLKKPDEKFTPEEQESYQEKLTQFYSIAAELVWLIGNTQPLNRGSGTYAELMLALICMHHGLQPPILKKEFPQLDVLDITFPLRDYKFFFPHFFEPSTIPESVRSKFNDIDSSQSVAAQMEQLYKKFNETLAKNKLAEAPEGSEHKLKR
jgi:hypothetical protein